MMYHCYVIVCQRVTQSVLCMLTDWASPSNGPDVNWDPAIVTSGNIADSMYVTANIITTTTTTDQHQILLSNTNSCCLIQYSTIL